MRKQRRENSKNFAQVQNHKMAQKVEINSMKKWRKLKENISEKKFKEIMAQKKKKKTKKNGAKIKKENPRKYSKNSANIKRMARKLKN